jgi:DNA-binding transcriptional LysR family regulator
MAALDLRRLRYFVGVAEELHFGRAARRLNLSQPSLSIQIRALERDVGTPLLARTQRRVELTEAGRVLLEDGRRLIGQSEAAIVHARRAAAGSIGRLAIGFVSTADYSILPPLVRRFRRKHPGVALKLRELTDNLQQALLLSGELDLGLSALPMPAPELMARPAFREPLIAAVPAAHALAKGARRIRLRALASEGFILFPRELAPGLYDLVIAACQRAGFTPTIAQEAIQMQTILGLVAAGLGVAVVPHCMSRLGRDDVRYLALDATGFVVETSALWQKSNAAPALAALLAELPPLRAIRRERMSA